MHPVTIFTGHFGSGKTEIAINYALYLQNQSRDKRERDRREKAATGTALVDLDLVNPYFRSRAAREFLRQQGVEAVVPPEEFLSTDLPVLPARFYNRMRRIVAAGGRLIIDVGGDECGALVLGHLKPWLQETGYNLWLVVNPYRPFSRRAEEVVETCRRIERASRLRINGLVGNPHLAEYTTPAVVEAGSKVIKEVAQLLGLPVCMWVTAKGLGRIPTVELNQGLWLEINCYLRPEWLKAE